MISRGLPIIGSVTIWGIACVLGWQAREAFRDMTPYTIYTAPAIERTDTENQIETSGSPETVDLSDALARPLFAPDRRPQAAPDESETLSRSQTVAETVQSDILPEVIVYGVALNGASSKALLSMNGSVPEWYGEKSIIAGWTLTKIETNGVLLQSETSELRIELY
ncbi:hypothetical protein GCM10007385_10580 [Tateyamaria omphalii]|uniref:hypothetical protein n=1 Tax=Tateyamaria omphalii TaxID=299262 RepID=UPI001678C97F|nr:hypothetical protein [Tateyamaria omphalii]GGX44518.1 hypothetical protein GCM10007385_10580 [Tateyamaria omphalii]